MTENQQWRDMRHRLLQRIAELEAREEQLVRRLRVASDWLADKGVPPDHIEMRRIRELLAQDAGNDVPETA